VKRVPDRRWPALKVSVAVLARVGLATLAASFVVACASGGTGTLAQQASTAATNAQAKLASATSSSTDSASSSQTATAKTKTTTETKTVTQPAQSRTVTATTTVSTPGQTTAITGNNTTVAVTPISTTASQAGSGVPWWGWVLIGLGVVGVAIAIFQLGRRRRGGGGSRPPDSGPSGSPRI